MSRALHACEGALLLVDAAQGVEAQTVANAYLAGRRRPRDRAGAEQGGSPRRPGRGRVEELRSSGSASTDRSSWTSAKTGEGVDEVLEAIVDARPAAAGRPDAPLRALIYDAAYDDYRGVVVYVRVIDGVLRKRAAKIQFLSDKSEFGDQRGRRVRPSPREGRGALGRRRRVLRAPT